MYKAKCTRCGEECEVPFEPDNERPVLCKKCFVPGIKKSNKQN